MLGLGLGVNRLAKSGAASPSLAAALFGAGEQGLWLDPSDLSTMFQDAAGTTPVTASGQPVGLILDKSGCNNHVTQATEAKRPIYRVYDGKSLLEFNGSSASMVTAASLNLAGSNKLSMFAGLNKLNDSTYRQVMELSTNVGLNNGCFAVGINNSAGVRWEFGVRGSALAAVGLDGSVPEKSVLTLSADIAAPQCSIQRNKSAPVVSAASLGTGNFGNQVLYLCGRGGTSSFFSGYLYGLVIRGATTAGALATSVQEFMADKSGVTL